MNKGFNIKIVHENMGTLLNETFSSGDQFKLFLRLVDGCMTHKSDFDFFNGEDFLSHIPFRILKDSVIMTNITEVSVTELVKSKIEAMVTR
jgi:hypothetical protein